MTRNEYTLDDDGACGFSRVRDWTRFEDIHNQSKEQGMKLQDTRPTGTIAFRANSSDVEVMRISRDGVWANPDIPADDAAKLVLGALDRYIKELVKRVVEDEREACAFQVLEGTGEPIQAKTLEVLRTERQRIADAIRARGEK